MLHDLKATYIRRESRGLPRQAPHIAAFIAIAALAFVALIAASVKYGPLPGPSDVSALYGP